MCDDIIRACEELDDQEGHLHTNVLRVMVATASALMSMMGGIVAALHVSNCARFL